MERPRPGVDTDDARAVLAGWLAEKGVPDGAVMIDNGSGLSRTSRVTARAMTQILAAGWLSPRMTEYAASLPVSGVDGTMRKRLEATGRTHLKTGYLQDVRSIGGYVYAKNGRRYALYAAGTASATWQAVSGSSTRWSSGPTCRSEAQHRRHFLRIRDPETKLAARYGAGRRAFAFSGFPGKASSYCCPPFTASSTMPGVRSSGSTCTVPSGL
ncbi:MAG: D-alanyl-D-alanine carboxypeptidase [Sutterella wadsworthensis]